ncbi:MAG TPA: hypothetical protein VI968_01675 [archaeon]|nr:hypothetical protein [archaeon]
MARTYPYPIESISAIVDGKTFVFEEVISQHVYSGRPEEHFQYVCKDEMDKVLHIYPEQPFPMCETFEIKSLVTWKDEIVQESTKIQAVEHARKTREKYGIKS